MRLKERVWDLEEEVSSLRARVKQLEIKTCPHAHTGAQKSEDASFYPYYEVCHDCKSRLRSLSPEEYWEVKLTEANKALARVKPSSKVQVFPPGEDENDNA